MQLKFYAVFSLLLFAIVFEDHTVDGQKQENDKVDSKAIGQRRLPRNVFLVKTAFVAGTIGLIAGLAIGHKKSRERNHIQAWGQRHYGKRSIGDDANQTGSVTPKYDDAELLRAAKILDQLGCGGRLLCELHQQKKEDLNETGRKIVQLFDEKQPPTVEQLKTDSKAVFQYAAFVGASVPKDLKICSRLFPKCPITTQAVADAFNNSNVVKSI